MKFLDLNKHIKERQFATAYNLYGDDAYLISNAIGQFSKIIDCPDFNILKLKNPNLIDLVDACNSLPIVSEYKLILAYDIKLKSTKSTATKSSSKATKKPTVITDESIIIEYLNNPNPTTILIFVDCTLGTGLGDRVVDLNCDKLDEKTLHTWINRECTRYKCTIEHDASSLLMRYCNNSLQRISLETSKLCAYIDGGCISVQDIKDMVYPDIAYSVFQLSDAVSSRDKGRAIEILEFLTRSGEEPVMLLGMLYVHFRRLLLTIINSKDPNLASLLGIKDYALNMLRNQSKQFKALQLKNILSILWKIDKDFRDGKFPLEWCVHSLIMQIA